MTRFLCGLAVMLLAQTAVGQIAGAMGKPLPRAEYETGMVTVRVLLGDPSKVQKNGTVQLNSPGGETKTETTDGEGRATFKGLPVGSQWVAVTTEAKQRTTSEPFVVPSQGGLALLMSPIPWGTAGGAKAKTSETIIPPVRAGRRQASGRFRTGAGGAGSIGVTVVKANGDVLTNHLVHLVGFSSDGKTQHWAKRTDKSGKAWFHQLEGGATRSYMLVTSTQRVDGSWERHYSQSAQLPPQVGLETDLIAELDGDLVDDVSNPYPADEPGVVTVALLGNGNPGEIRLRIPGKSDVLATATPTLGTFKNGQQFSGARFTGLPAGSLLVAEYFADGQLFLSRPIPLTEDKGAVVGLPVGDIVVAGFHLGGIINDEYLGFQGDFVIYSASIAPHNPGPEGLLLPLPKGFLGATVEEAFENKVLVEPGAGLRWRGMIPPSGTSFRAGFSLKAKGGKALFELELPFGALGSNINLLWREGMKVLVPQAEQVPVQKVTMDSGVDVFAIGVDKRPGENLVFRVVGLPQYPASHRYAVWFAGIVAGLLLLWPLGLIVYRVFTGEGEESTLTELVELEVELRLSKISQEEYDRRKKEILKK